MLVLYWTPTPPSEIRAAIRHHLEAIKYGPSHHRVIFWNAFEGSPILLRGGAYDAVILHTTLLCLRWFPTFSEWRRKLSWIAALDCLKIAMPQDEYDHSEILDEWLGELGVQHVFSNFGDDVRSLLYPTMSGRAQFHAAFTGYIDEGTARRIEAGLEASGRRPFDVVYRASHLPYWFGSLGQLKHRIGERAKAEAESRHLAANVSTRTEDAIMGDEWFTFLAAGRTVVGCESGSSVLDRRGEIQSSIREYLERQPNASFEQVSAHMPVGWDSYRFAAVSPRHFEAVITRTCQVLVRGRYDGVLAADRHYIPVSPDLSDLGVALEKGSDPALASEISSRTYEEVYRSGRYTYRVLAEQIDRVLETRPPKRPLVGAAASALAASWGAWRLRRPSDLDSTWTIAAAELPSHLSAGGAPPLQQIKRLVAHPAGRALLVPAVRGRIGRRLLREYIRARRAAEQISAAQLLAEAQLLDRMARAQEVEPHAPRSRAIKASRVGDALDLRVLRPASDSDRSNGDLGTWPPPAITVRVATFRGSGDAMRLDAVSALAAARPRGARSALHPLLDTFGGARSRPRAAGRRNKAKMWIVAVRTLATRPHDAWLLARNLREVPLSEAVDDLVKFALMTKAQQTSDMAVEVDREARLLRVVTRPDRHEATRAGIADAEPGRIVWDNSAAGRYVFAPVALGRRLTVFLGAAGIHEFTALEALPPAARRKILRRIAASGPP